MPVYTYHCSSCDKEFEVNQRMSDAPLTDCDCGAKGTVKRLLSAGAGVIFKGSGFYQTDYKNANGSSGSAPKSESPKSESSKSESSSSESKPSGGGCGPSCGCGH